MSETQENANLVQAETVENASRPPIKPPEHRMVQEAAVLGKPEPDQLLSKDVLSQAALVTQDMLAKAERNLADYIGVCMKEQNLEPLTENLKLSLENTYELTGEKLNDSEGARVARSAIKLKFSGDAVRSNHVRMNGTILGMLQHHPILGRLNFDSHPGMKDFRTREERLASHEVMIEPSHDQALANELKFAISNLSDDDYGLLIKALAEHENAKPVDFFKGVPYGHGKYHTTINPKIAEIAGLVPAAQLAAETAVQLQTDIAADSVEKAADTQTNMVPLEASPQINADDALNVGKLTQKQLAQESDTQRA